MAVHNDRGREGEAQAAAYLEQAGYEIMDVNWTSGREEIDIVAYKDRQIIFVEVKCRSNLSFGEPEDFVTPAKQKRLARAARAYVDTMAHQGEIRFDIISIVLHPDSAPVMKHIEDAFWPSYHE
ncbi:YraN family protein [Pedobacter sp. SYP-B3415]|uniref:YraN family protein n=1 Tax=Pedobacter sp. SYP-B3415 TaxID=2496641 RepID=UPI00101C09CE|nr:YraN family protein [Pedobacter sp. SYP-B3415]